MSFNNKAAMFGLDARIALAIFGALSVITGAALFSAIQDAKTTAFLTDMQEVGKAYDAYYLDTGSKLPINTTNIALKIENLIENAENVNNWHGPYLSYEKKNELNLYYKGGSSCVPNCPYDLRIVHFLDGKWTENHNSSNWEASMKCGTGTAGGICAVWVRLFGISDELYTSLEKKVDGIVNDQEGTIRRLKFGTGPNYFLMKYRPVQ